MPARSIPRQELIYTFLPPGSYRLHVQAIAADGTPSEERVSPLIVIRPPFWSRPLFIVGGIVFGALFLVGLVSLVQQRRYNLQMEREVQRRTEDLATSREALKREKERLAATLTAITDGVLVVNTEGLIALANPAAGHTLDCPAAELVGRPAPRWLVEGEASPVEFVGPDGKRRLVERSITPLRLGSGSGLSARVVAFRDVTERARTEQELIRTQKLESLGLLAGGIAHDFNNLLTVILGNLSVLRQEVGDARLAEGIADAERACRVARELTDQLLTFSKGGQPLREPVRLDALVREIMPLALSGSRVRGEVEVDPALPLVEVNRGQVDQVLSNLLINAVQATCAADDGSGAPAVIVRLRHTVDEPLSPGPGPWVLLEVEDRGVGIRREDLPRIFDPYCSTKPGGHGLGLAVAHSIVRRHGGYLQVDSVLGRGSVFRVWLPASQAVGRSAEPDASLPATDRLRILVMDDEAAIRRILAQMLERLGHQVETVPDGAALVETYQRTWSGAGAFDVVITDLTVPSGMGGREAAARLRRFDPDARIVVASGFSSDPVLGHFEEYGFDAALEKPFDLAGLKRILGRVLERRPLRRRDGGGDPTEGASGSSPDAPSTG
ncbi:MAG: ATP-binding protein [Acidobacteriota bacterium]|nr:ATP-binding protein [Acidobacteriota bacterium]